MNLSIPKHCSCGKDHTSVLLPRVEIGSDILRRTPGLLQETFGKNRIHLVWDQNTREASRNLHQLLEDAGFQITQTLFEDMQWATLNAAERIIQESKAADFLMAVGTGSLNDLTKYAAFSTGKKAAVFATAPSMDGFLSIGAALYHNGFKDSFDTAPPAIVLGDSGVLSESPVKLKASGFGDLLGKYTALCDWKAAHLLTGEYWCPEIDRMTRESVEKAIRFCDEIPEKNPQAAEALMEGLCLSGLAMLLCGNSRPASGAEHHFSHFWEMILIRDGIRPDYHGRKVGVASELVADYYHEAAEKEIHWEYHPICEEGLREIYTSLSDEILKENTPDPLADISVEKIQNTWEQIRKEIDRIPTGSEIAELLSRAGGAVLPQQVGISAEQTRQALNWACYTRKRLTILRLLSLSR